MKQRNLLAILLLFVGVTVSASVNSGYYYIKSYNDNYMTENTSEHSLVCSAKATSTNYAQVWYLAVSGSNVTLRNALTDRYVQGQGSFSSQYSTGTTQQTFTLGESEGVLTFQYDPYNVGGLHCDASLNVVEWYTSDNKSKWTIETVDIDTDDLTAQKNALTEVSISTLTTYFTSSACTALNSPYSGYTENELRSAMSTLPTSVQDLAVKIRNNTWATYGSWDKTEKTFRIADYKAYSSHTRWTSVLKFSHSLGRLSNPTGIWVNSGEYLQVYVGAIPSGQSVKLEVAGYGQASGTQYSLHQGMNALQMASAGNCFVFYEVDNTTDGGTPYKALSNYADVTVHIEGGTVQGYFDLTKGDDDNDWAQLKSHLLTNEANRPSVCLKTDKHVMNLGITRLNNALNSESIVDMLNVWANLAQWEDELCGRTDEYGGQERYGQYCNNIFSVTALPGSDGNPHASSYGTYYYEYSDPAIFNANALLTVADNMWCIAHEQGHNRQNPINMAGNTEVSNNLFSNAAIYKQGRYTSRTASIQTVFNDYLNGVSWPERVQRSCAGVSGYNQHLLKLNWQLYLYFHVLGKDPDFFPRLFDALREDPMTRQDVSVDDNGNIIGGAFTAATDDYLKYYIKCCVVSGYDLTEFFTAYGFFTLPPAQTSKTLGNVTATHYVVINDYSKTGLYTTQAMIDNAKAAVAAVNGLKPCNIVFIEDRVTAPLATYEGHSEGEQKQINPDGDVQGFGLVGEMGQYTDFDDSVIPTACSYNVSERGHVTVVGGDGAVGFIVYDASGNPIAFANTRTFTLPANVTNYTIKAAAADGTAVSATYDASIEVDEFPKTDVWYTFCSTLRGSRFVMSNGIGEGVTGISSNSILDAMQWQFVLREGEVETFDIVNRADGSYLNPATTYNTQLTTTATQPSAGWQVGAAATAGMYIIYSGSTQLNQTNSNLVYNWGSGSNTSDTGCQYTISEVVDISNAALAELEGWNISVSATAANSLTTGQWYVMYDRGYTGSNPHGYLYEDVSSHTLYNTSSIPTGSATDACRYLVRLIDAKDGKYYLQTGYGNYFGQIQSSTPVPTISIRSQRVTVGKINQTDGHFYIQGEAGGVILDANDVGMGDATVVGYGITVPTTTGGNNDWAFYPVTLIYPVTLKEVGDASYATLYLPFDVQTDADTKAYYIKTVSNDYAPLTGTTNNGRDIPAHTAVILINDAKATHVNLTQAVELSAVISEEDNMLKGTLENKTLDLSQDSPYYSLGRMDGNIGFYKFNNNGTTSITLGANKAYLEVPQSDNVKGFALTIDTADGISAPSLSSDLSSYNATIFNLAGQRLSKPGKGVFIINGKKVLK